MFDHDHAVTIAGLRAERDSLIVSLRAAIDDGSTSEERLMRMIAEAELACVTAERDALAAQLAEVRAKLDAAPKVCAIHSYEHGPGPCMTCGAWPPGTRELIAACQTRIAGLEQAADERSAEVARLTARVAELEARPVLTHEILSAAIKKARRLPPYIARQAADEYMPHLGPVTLPPAQDRAEELCRAYHERAADMDGHMVGRWQYHGPESQAICTEAMRRALASLGAPPTSPPAARPVFAGVSEEELALEYARAVDRIPGIRAVLARLEVSLVAPVDPEAVSRQALRPLAVTMRSDEVKRSVENVRATLTAAGIPVTPEVGK